MSTSSGKPPVKPVGQGGSIRNRYKQRAARLHDPADFCQRGGKIGEVLETMVRYDGCESPIREREVRGIALYKLGAGSISLRHALVDSHNLGERCAGRRTSRRAAQIEKTGAGLKMAQDLVHDGKQEF